MRFQKVGVLLKELGSGFVRSLPAKISRADQGRDVGGQSGWRITAGFLPSFLLRHRPVPKQVTRGFQDHRIGVEILKGVLLAEAQGQQYGEGDLVQLDSPPIRVPVDPEVLRETAIFLLRHGKIDERPQRGGALTGRRAERRRC